MDDRWWSRTRAAGRQTVSNLVMLALAMGVWGPACTGDAFVPDASVDEPRQDGRDGADEADDGDAWPGDDGDAWPGDDGDTWPGDDGDTWPGDDGDAWPGDDGDAGDADEDLGDDLGLFIPEGSQACTLARIDPNDLRSTFDAKGRVTFWPGLVRLYRDRDGFSADLVQVLAFGPRAAAAEPLGAGSFSREPPTRPDSDYRYRYTQSFNADGQRYEFSLVVRFACRDYEPIEKVVTLDDAALCDWKVSGTGSWPGGTATFGSCRYTKFTCLVERFEFEGGDALKTETCRYCPPDWICKSSLGGFRRAEYLAAAGERYTEDFFKLAFSSRHHDWGSDRVVLFDAPVQGAFGLYLGTDPVPRDFSFSQVSYLGRDYEVQTTARVTKYESGIDW